jgi:hypothetical protein
MQDTPLITYSDSWVIEVVSTADCRQQTMMWNRYGCDGYGKWGNKGEMMTPNANSAIKLCQKMGWEYEVIYARDRYHAVKSYAENFASKKEQMSDTEEGEIDFSRI